MVLSEQPTTVLVVEDEDGVRVPIVRALRRRGFTVLEAEHGAEALERYREHGLPIDLLLTDVMMPHLNGRELARELRDELPELRVLYMTGFSDQAIDLFVNDPATTAFIEKPFPMTRLLAALQDLIERDGA